MPDKHTRIAPGDTLVAYGHQERLEQLESGALLDGEGAEAARAD